MKRLLTLCLILCTLCACFTACGDGPKEYNGYKMISNTEVVEYYFYVPESWDVDRQDGMTAAHVSSSDLTNVSVSTHELSAPMTLDEYCDEYQATLAQTYGAPTYSKQKESCLLGGQAAVRTEYTLKVGETTAYYMQIICLYQSRAYMVTYTAHSAEKLAEHAETVETMLGAFEFIA